MDRGSDVREGVVACRGSRALGTSVVSETLCSLVKILGHAALSRNLSPIRLMSLLHLSPEAAARSERAPRPMAGPEAATSCAAQRLPGKPRPSLASA